MGDSAHALDSLRAAFRDSHRVVDGAMSVCGVAPAALLEPASPAEAAAMLAFCTRHTIRVFPVGGRTWLNGGDAPSPAYAMISTSRLNEVEQYEPADLTITCGAGARIVDVQRAVNANRQWLAQDAPALSNATIGGWTATASSGPLRARYGTPRDHVLGVEIATLDGRLVRLGGRVVKNVAGYDLVRPIAGSHGMLGLITSVSVRLRPMHERDATLAFAVPRDEAHAGVDLLSRTFPLAAVELLSPWLATALLGAPAAHPDWTIIARIHGNEAEVQHGIEQLRAALPETALELSPMHSSGPEIWDRLGNVEASAPASVRLSARPTALQMTLDTANSLADLIFAGTPMIAAHAGDGIVRAWGSRRDNAPTGAIGDARRRMAEIDGSLVCTQGLGARSSPGGRKAMLNASIRKVFDPAGIFAVDPV